MNSRLLRFVLPYQTWRVAPLFWLEWLMRVFALSDIHVDYLENMNWIKALSADRFSDDVLVLSGDVTHVMSRLEAALTILKQRFARLFYVPGNHELWVNDGAYGDSIQKFDAILELCRRLGVETEPARLPGSNPVWLVPLFSWYTMPQQGSDSLFLPKEGEDPSLDMWSDLYFIKWPALEVAHPAAWFAALNKPILERAYDAPVISFSHFLPRSDLMFGKSPGGGIKDRNRSFNFSRVAGSTLIEDSLRRLGSVMHLFGHQHRNRYRIEDGVLYVSHCLGYHKEREMNMIRYIEMGPRLVWDTETEVGNPDLAEAGLLAPSERSV